MAKSEESERIGVPPYLPFRTFHNFSTGLKSAIPPVIDRSVMRTYGGAVQSQLLAALRYLKLIDSENRTQEVYRRYISVAGDEQNKILRDILERAYPFLFKANDNFSLDSATPSQFSDKFKKAGATGETVRKCELFFIKAAQAAGITLSPHILNTPKAQANGDTPKPPRSRSGSGKQKKTGDESPATLNPLASLVTDVPKSAYDQMLLVLVSKFPDFNPEWSDEAINSWHQNFGELMNRILSAKANTQDTEE